MMAVPEPRMPPMPLSQLLDRRDGEFGATRVTGVELDSRRVRPGDLFFAMPGDVHDGRQFIEQAVAAGASAVLAEAPAADLAATAPVPLVEIPGLRQQAGVLAARFYHHPSRDMQVTGVTGTNGKTTTSRIIAQLSRALGRPCGVIGTLGATLEDEVLVAGNTTPDALTLQRQLAAWRQQGVSRVSMEVSSHALVQGRVNGVAFDTAIYTNLSRDHLDYHRSMADYARAKLRLFASAGLRCALLNVDDELAALFAAAVTGGAQILTYSASGAGADVRVAAAHFHAQGVRAHLSSPWGEGRLDSPLPGRFNLANVAAAVAALAAQGADLPALLEALPRLRPVPGRMQAVPNALGLQVVIDYAHTPEALRQAIAALRPHVEGALITVFGCGGDRDRDKRPLMGRAACELSDRVLLTSDNPRGEDPLAILRDIASGCDGNFDIEPDRAAAIEAAIAAARPGDCVLIAGKGHETCQILERERLPFSDEQAARDALARRARA